MNGRLKKDCVSAVAVLVTDKRPSIFSLLPEYGQVRTVYFPSKTVDFGVVWFWFGPLNSGFGSVRYEVIIRLEGLGSTGEGFFRKITKIYITHML